MTNKWTDTLNWAELDCRYALAARLDPRMARLEREFYESRTIEQLLALTNQAWNIGDGDAYQLARSYLRRSA